MSEQLPYEDALRDGLNELPLPNEDGAWEAMRKKLEDDGNDRVPPFVFLRGCMGWSLLLVAVLVGLWFWLRPDQWGHKKEGTATQMATPSRTEAPAAPVKKEGKDEITKGGTLTGTPSSNQPATSPNQPVPSSNQSTPTSQDHPSAVGSSSPRSSSTAGGAPLSGGSLLSGSSSSSGNSPSLNGSSPSGRLSSSRKSSSSNKLSAPRNSSPSGKLSSPNDKSSSNTSSTESNPPAKPSTTADRINTGRGKMSSSGISTAKQNRRNSSSPVARTIKTGKSLNAPSHKKTFARRSTTKNPDRTASANRPGTKKSNTSNPPDQQQKSKKPSVSNPPVTNNGWHVDSLSSATLDLPKKPSTDTSKAITPSTNSPAKTNPKAGNPSKPVTPATADSAARITTPGKKKLGYYFSAGIGLQQQIPIAGQKITPYNYYGRKGSLADYIPSVYLRLHHEQRWFVQGEFRYGAPQSVKEFSYSQTTTTDTFQIIRTTSSLRLKKTFYHQLPLSFNYYVLPHWSVGAGVMYSRFHGAITEQEVNQSNRLTQRDTILLKQVIHIPGNTDSFFTRSQMHVLFQTEYTWRWLSFSLRYTCGLQPYIRYLDAAGQERSQTNQAFDAALRFRLWQSKKARK